jgi:nicotinate-nucleotide adenylyltransferase
MRIGILGGTFDPIHLRHIELALGAMRDYDLAKVYVMPDSLPTYRQAAAASANDRLAMVKLSVMGIDGLAASDFELKREGPTYTSDTVSELKRIHPDWDIYFIIGGDSVMYIEKWHEPQVIFDNCSILYIVRPGNSASETEEHISMLKEEFSNVNMFPVHIPESPVSATEIREKIRMGITDPDELHLNKNVCDYIFSHGLYKA